MSNIITKKNIYICIGLVALLPIILNFLLLIPSFCDVVGTPESWLNFWPVYISSIASFAMILITYKSLVESRKQFDETSRTRLVSSVLIYEKAYYLKIANVGLTNAFNIKLSINDEFIEKINEREQRIFRELSKPFFIESGKSANFFIGFCEDVNRNFKDVDVNLIIQGCYNDKYIHYELIDMQQVVNKLHFIVRGELETIMEHIREGLTVQNDQYMPVQKSLHLIAKQLEDVAKKIDNVNQTISQIDIQPMIVYENKSEEANANSETADQTIVYKEEDTE